jgi:hypothetical protein
VMAHQVAQTHDGTQRLRAAQIDGHACPLFAMISQQRRPLAPTPATGAGPLRSPNSQDRDVDDPPRGSYAGRTRPRASVLTPTVLSGLGGQKMTCSRLTEQYCSP